MHPSAIRLTFRPELPSRVHSMTPNLPSRPTGGRTPHHDNPVGHAGSLPSQQPDAAPGDHHGSITGRRRQPTGTVPGSARRVEPPHRIGERVGTGTATE